MSQRISDIVAAFRDRITDVNKRRDEIDAAIAELEAERDVLPKVGATEIVKDIAELIQPALKEYKVRALGPFGLTSEVAIHVEGSNGRAIASISMRPEGYNETFDLKRVDHSRNTGRFGRNTIGEMNGMNFPEVNMPDTIDDLVSDLQQQIAERQAAETA